MIPLKEEPTINAALCFSEEDAQTLLRCQAALAHAGNVVIASARHENLLAHYTRTLLAEINQASGFSDAKVSIRKMPKSSDGLLERLNEHLASMDIAALQSRRIVKTREVWLYELPGPSQSELLQMAANMVRQFKAAGVSVIVHSRQARPDSPHLQKLAERLRAQHAVFQTPDEVQCKALAEVVKGRPEAGQVQQLIRSLGVTVEYDEAANLADMQVASSLSNLIQKAEQGLPLRPQAQAPVSTESAKPASISAQKVEPPKPPISGVSNTRILASSGIACLLIVGLYFTPNADFFRWVGSVSSNLSSSAEDWFGSQMAMFETATDTQGPSASAINIPLQTPEKTDTQDARVDTAETGASTSTTRGQVDQAAITQGPELTPEVQAMDPEEGLKTLFPVAAPITSANVTQIPTRSAPVEPAGAIAFEPGVYVQHASFRLPQSALIWRNNNNELPGVKVAAKGERFVTVSGPFVNRDQALDYLTQFGITAQPYFVDGGMLRGSGQI